MWGISGLYFVFMLVLMGMQYVPTLQYWSFDFLEPFTSSPGNPYASVYPVMGLMILLYPTTIGFTRAFQKFKKTEMEIMAKMVRILFPHVEFTQMAKAPAKEVMQSKLFAWIKEDAPIYSYGQIRSRVTDIEINIADLGIIENNVANKLLGTVMHIPILNMLGVLYQNVFKNLATNKLADNTKYSFRGMFCWLNLKKKLNGHTVLLPKNQMAQLDRWASFNFKKEEQIHMEDPRFSENFIVYGTDQVEARYVLSSSIMEKVVALKEKFDRPIFLSFQNRQMYIALVNEYGLFSFPAGKLDSLNMVEELATDIDTALNIPEELFKSYE
jgi:hypothetical protein